MTAALERLQSSRKGYGSRTIAPVLRRLFECPVRIGGARERKGCRPPGPQHAGSERPEQIVRDRPHLFRRVRVMREIGPRDDRRFGGKTGDVDRRDLARGLAEAHEMALVASAS